MFKRLWKCKESAKLFLKSTDKSIVLLENSNKSEEANRNCKQESRKKCASCDNPHQSFISSSRIYKPLLGEVRGAWSVPCSASECWTAGQLPAGSIASLFPPALNRDSRAPTMQPAMMMFSSKYWARRGLSLDSAVPQEYPLSRNVTVSIKRLKIPNHYSCQIVSEMFRHFQMAVLWGLLTEQIYLFSCSEKV